MLRGFWKDKEFFRMFILITLPIAGQNFLTFAVSMADTVMVGQLGEVQLSAVQQANQLGFLMNLIIFGLSGGANVMIAQYWGKRDVGSIHKVLTITYRILAGIVLTFTILALCFSTQVMRMLGVEAIVEEGAAFLRIVGLGYAFSGFAVCTLIVLRSVASVRISMVVYIVSLIVNVSGNWILIFGKLGMPAMGVRGAAIATVLARVFEIAIVALYMLKFEKKICYPFRLFLAKKLYFFREFIRNALPVLLNEVFWGMGAVTLSIIIGKMGTEFTAANSVCSVLSQLVTVAIFGAGSASSVIIGNTVGAGHYDLARRRAGKLLVMSGSMGVVAMCMVFLLKGPMLLLFTSLSDTARLYADQIMTVYAFIVLFQSFAMVSVVGVLRGGGDGRFAALADVLTMWCISIPLGFLAGHVWGWPVPVVYAILKVDEAFKTIICLPRLLSGQWVNDVTR